MDVLDRSYEPMDVDLSNNSGLNCSVKSVDLKNVQPSVQVKDRDESCGNLLEHQNPEVKPKLPAIRVKKLYVNLTPTKRKCSNLNIVIGGVFFAFISVIICYNFKVNCSNRLDVSLVQELLQNKLYGQQIPIEDIAESLQHNNSNKILFFYGRTGVGKTYAISLMFKDLWDYSNVYHYTMPSFKFVFSNSLMAGLLLCPSTIIVIDGLSNEDMDLQFYVKKIIDKINYLGKKITIILVYNCDVTYHGFLKKCDDLFLDNLERSYAELNVDKYYIKFNELSNEHLKKCIEDELKISENVAYPDINRLMNNFDVSVDGCKSVHRKIKILNV